MAMTSTERGRTWRAKNRERNLELKRQYRERHATRISAQKREYRKRRAAEIAQQRRRWKDANREKVRLDRAAYRARLAGASEALQIAPEALAAKISMHGGRCWICRLAPYEHLDHVKPLAAGGLHILANLRPACAACNTSKGSRWPYTPSTPANLTGVLVERPSRTARVLP